MHDGNQPCMVVPRSIKVQLCFCLKGGLELCCHCAVLVLFLAANMCGTPHCCPAEGTSNNHLSLQLPFCAFEVLDEQVLASELLVVGEMIDALPVMQVDLVQLIVDPPTCTHTPVLL